MKKLLFPTCIFLAVLIIVVSMTAVSFSWFAPEYASGVGLQFSETTSVRSENCEITTYFGTNNNGVITYGDTPVTSSQTISSSGSGDSIESGVKYYKTVIVNSNENYDTNVSLYLQTFTVNNGAACIGVAAPTNTYREFKATKSDVHIVRNAYIAAYSYDQPGSGSLAVEWFVRCDNGGATFDPSSIYLVYN